MTKPFSFALCADDYAMTPGISRGILEALEAQALSATSAMTTSPWWPYAAEPLKRHAGRADIGLHFNLTQDAPLGPMPQLAPEGRFPDIGTLVRLARRKALPLEEIAAEVDRQADRFLAAFGRPPDHVDGHQHVHVLAPIAALILETLRRRGWHPWLRDSADRFWRILARRSSLKKAAALAVLGDGFGTRARRAGFATNDGFAGFSRFDPSASYASQFAHYLVAPGPRHLVMCHPGYADDALRALDPVVETREQELRFLLSDELAHTLANVGASIGKLGLEDGPGASSSAA